MFWLQFGGPQFSFIPDKARPSFRGASDELPRSLRGAPEIITVRNYVRDYVQDYVRDYVRVVTRAMPPRSSVRFGDCVRLGWCGVCATSVPAKKRAPKKRALTQETSPGNVCL